MIDLLVVRVLPYAVLGVLLAVAYFSALAWNVRLYVQRGAGWNVLFVHLMRLLLVGGALTACSRQGALPLLSSMAGFQIMRTATINQRSRAFERRS